MNTNCFAVLVTLVFLTHASTDLSAATFEILFPYGGSSGLKSVHVSDDGSIVLGSYYGGSGETYIWELSKGITYRSGYDGVARPGMSGDGRTILTWSYPSSFSPIDASFDGSVVAGVQGSGSDPFAIDAVGIVNGQLINLGKLAPNDTGSRAWAVSADGSTIVGASYAQYDRRIKLQYLQNGPVSLDGRLWNDLTWYAAGRLPHSCERRFGRRQRYCWSRAV